MKLLPSNPWASVHITTAGGAISFRRGAVFIGLKITCGRSVRCINSVIEGPTALPMPHKNIPPLANRSCSFLKRICSIGSPASHPNLVQQKRLGSSCKNSLPIQTDYALVFTSMQEDSLSERLRSFMEERQLSQKRVADAADISQSTVSRALKGHFERQGGAKSKLFTYIQNELLNEELSGKGKDKVVRAFESIWDRSEEHAVAIAKIIKASGGLLPRKTSRR